MKKCQKVRKSAKNYETILPFSCCPLVFSLINCRDSHRAPKKWPNYGTPARVVYYEARKDYTNNSETILLCNRCACNWKINSQTINMCNCQKFRQGVGGQRGLARGNPSKARDSGLFSVPFSYAPLGEWGHISGDLFGALFGALFVANPLPPTPFRNLRNWRTHRKYLVSVAPPAEPRGEKKLFFCANFGR